ncbi:Solute carrier family 41 member 3, partial [Eschrichtius robustus]|nr:Solute carrier family 41 member 3 [Eschrichtius robustus]
MSVPSAVTASMGGVDSNEDSRYLMPLVCVGFMALTPVCILVAKQNPPVVKILKFGWFPIVLAMLVSSFGGLILNKTISKQQFRGMAIFAPIICGVGGNLVAIQTSRISTYLHLWSTPGVTVLLYLAEATVRLTWNQALDPDDHCIPYLTGLGDLLGTGLLALCFLAHWLLRGETGLDGTSEPASGPSRTPRVADPGLCQSAEDAHTLWSCCCPSPGWSLRSGALAGERPCLCGGQGAAA